MDKRENQRYQSERIRKRRRRRRKKKLLRAIFLIFVATVAIFLLLLVFQRTRHLPNAEKVEDVFHSWGFRSVDIILDAGHGGKDQGASGGDAIEKEITLEIAKKTEAILEEAGYKVGMVRDDDTFVELGERAEYANRKKAKVFVSIHCNSSEDGEGNGIETFYTEQKGENSQKLAKLIQENAVAQTGARDREAKTANYAVIVNTEMPAALVETGFLSDSNERELLQQEEYQEKLAAGVAAGIIEYLEQENIE